MDSKIGILQQRRIEAGIIHAFYIALSKELGEERALALIASVIREIAFARGRELRASNPAGNLSTIGELWKQLGSGGALDVEFIEQSDDSLQFRVNRCGYADAYADMGISPKLGAILSCSRDEALLRGFSDDITFECSRTIMEGDAFCRFTYRLRKK